MVPPNNLGPDLSGKAINETQYRGMIGSLMYLTACRPDIQFLTCLCARYQANPKESYVIAVKRIFRYLKGTHSLGLWYPKCSGFNLKGYSDSDYARCNKDGKSTSGACQLLGGKLHLADIFSKPMDEPTFKRLIVELGGIRGDIGINTFRNALRAHYLPHSSMYVSPPSITIVRPWFETIGYSREIKAKGTLKKSYLPPRWRPLMAQVIQCLDGKIGGLDQISNKDATIMYFLANRVKVRILQKSQENGQIRTNTNTGTDRVYKSQKFLAKEQNVIKCSHWLELTRGMTRWMITNTPNDGKFTLNPVQKKHKASDTRNATLAIRVVTSENFRNFE
ncbi:hypothetical protein Tco_0983312 [Tanacetum coccineum]